MIPGFENIRMLGLFWVGHMLLMICIQRIVKYS